MTTRSEVLKALADIEKLTGPLSPVDRQHVAVPRGQLAILIEAAKNAIYSGEFLASDTKQW